MSSLFQSILFFAWSSFVLILSQQQHLNVSNVRGYIEFDDYTLNSSHTDIHLSLEFEFDASSFPRDCSVLVSCSAWKNRSETCDKDQLCNSESKEHSNRTPVWYNVTRDAKILLWNWDQGVGTLSLQHIDENLDRFECTVQVSIPGQGESDHVDGPVSDPVIVQLLHCNHLKPPAALYLCQTTKNPGKLTYKRKRIIDVDLMLEIDASKERNLETEYCYLGYNEEPLPRSKSQFDYSDNLTSPFALDEFSYIWTFKYASNVSNRT